MPAKYPQSITDFMDGGKEELNILQIIYLSPYDHIKSLRFTAIYHQQHPSTAKALLHNHIKGIEYGSLLESKEMNKW